MTEYKKECSHRSRSCSTKSEKQILEFSLLQCLRDKNETIVQSKKLNFYENQYQFFTKMYDTVFNGASNFQLHAYDITSSFS